MTYLVIGLLLFLGVHSIGIVAPAWRDRMVTKIGAGPWRGLYSLISIAGFVLLIWGYGLARQHPALVYASPLWTRRATALLMLPVFTLLLAAYLPGQIKAAFQHPMLVGVMLWAVAHLFANGTVADLLLFGGFLVWAVADWLSYKWRPARAIRTAPPSRFNDFVAVAAGVMLYITFTMWIHVRWFGVSVFPL